MKPHQERVVTEKSELDEKRYKLTAFTFSDTFAALPKEEQERLNRQHSIMEQYSNVLGERIAAFTDKYWDERQVNLAVEASCSCGGKGPEDGCCPACEVWHRLNGVK